MRIGIIGTRWGLMHVGAFRGAGAEVVALCGRDADRTRQVAARPSAASRAVFRARRRDADRTRQVAAREGIPVATTNLSELCAACDVVVVASPDALHREHVAAALHAGRHVLCEKPLTRTAAEAEELTAREKEAGQACAVSFPYRFLPPIVVLRQRLRTLGPLCHAAVTILSSFAAAQEPGPPEVLMGASGDFGGMSHMLDAAMWLSEGEPAWTEAVLSGRPVHSAALHVKLDSGATLTLTHLAAAEPGIAGNWVLLGQGWQAEWASGYRPDLGGWRIGPVRLFLEGRWSEVAPVVGPRVGEREPWAQAHVEGARAFLNLIRTGERGSLGTFAQGARVQRVLAAALCAETQARRVSLAEVGTRPR